MSCHRLTLCEVLTGIVLRSDGHRADSTRDDAYTPQFDRYEDAVAEKDRLLGCFPHVEVWIQSPKQAPERFVDQERVDAWWTLRDRYLRWCHSSWFARRRAKRPPRPPFVPPA